MSYYGISAIKLNRQCTEVDEVKIHRAVRRAEGPPHGWTEGEPMHYTDVANLIVGGDQVYVLAITAPGEFAHTDRVRVKPGQYEYLESHDDGGRPTLLLLQLPEYTVGES